MSGFYEGDKVRLIREKDEYPQYLSGIGTVTKIISHKEVYVNWDEDDEALIHKQSELELIEETSDATK